MNNRALITLLLSCNVGFATISSSASQITKGDDDAVILNNGEDRVSNTLKLPQTKQLYTWENNNWSLYQVFSTKWNSFNMVSDEVIANYENDELLDYTHNVYEYDTDGRLINNLEQSRYSESDPWTNDYMYSYKYDDTDKSFCNQSDCFRWNWMLDDWEYANGYGYFYDIIRDDSNRILNITKYESIQSTIILESIEFEYKDATGPATNISVERIDENYELVPYEYYDNIRWEKSNCNYLRYKDSRYYRWTVDPENIMKTANLYTYNKYGNKEFNSRLDYTYDEEGRKRTCSIYSSDGVNVMNAYEYDTTPNGGFNYYLFKWKDLDNSKKYEKGEETLDKSSECVSHDFDSYGNEILIESKLYNDKTGLFDKPKYKQVYDIEYLDAYTIKQYVYTCYNKYEEVSKKEKVVYDNFIDGVATDIKTVTESNIKVYDGYVTAPEHCRYIISDLQGRILKSGVTESERISYNELPSGVYIISVNGNQVKIMH